MKKIHDLLQSLPGMNDGDEIGINLKNIFQHACFSGYKQSAKMYSETIVHLALDIIYKLNALADKHLYVEGDMFYEPVFGKYNTYQSVKLESTPDLTQDPEYIKIMNDHYFEVKKWVAVQKKVQKIKKFESLKSPVKSDLLNRLKEVEAKIPNEKKDFTRHGGNRTLAGYSEAFLDKGFFNVKKGEWRQACIAFAWTNYGVDITSSLGSQHKPAREKKKRMFLEYFK